MKSRDFSFVKYRELLVFLLDKGYNFYPVYDWISEQPVRGIILRHDVDRYPFNSLNNARIEYEHGIKSTYYFRIWRNVLNFDIVNQISSWGHEIGYHYEELSTTNGDYESAIVLFRKNLNNLRKYANIKTISMHGRPSSKIDNRKLWDNYKFQEFEILGEAYLSIDYEDIYYLTDTGRTWNNNKFNLRDNVFSKKTYDLTDTDSVMRFIDKINPLKLAILTHPERWNDSRYFWYKYFLRDHISRLVKSVLIKYRLL